MLSAPVKAGPNAGLGAARTAFEAASVNAGVQVIPAPAVLAAMCDLLHFQFLVEGVPQPAAAVLSEDLLFPAVAWVAHANGRDLMQADLGYRFEVDAQAVLGLRVNGPPVTAHTADLYRALFLMDACTTLFCVEPNGAVEIATVAPQLRELLSPLLTGASFPRQAARAESSASGQSPMAVN